MELPSTAYEPFSFENDASASNDDDQPADDSPDDDSDDDLPADAIASGDVTVEAPDEGSQSASSRTSRATRASTDASAANAPTAGPAEPDGQTTAESSSHGQEGPECYRLLVETMADLVCLHDTDGTVLWMSPSCTDLLGYSPDALVGNRLSDHLHPSDADRLSDDPALLIPASDGDGAPSPSGVTYRLQHQDGHYVQVETRSRPLTREGTVVGYQSTTRPVGDRAQPPGNEEASGTTSADETSADETVRRPEGSASESDPEAGTALDVGSIGVPEMPCSDELAAGDSPVDPATVKAELRKTKSRLRAALTLGDVSIFSQDRRLCYTWVSNHVFGVAPNDLVGQSDTDVFPDETAALLTDLKRQVLETGEPQRETLSLPVGDSRPRFDLYLAPLTDDAGSVVGLTGATRTASPSDTGSVGVLGGNLEHAVDILSSIRDGFFALDPDWRFLYVNPAAADILDADRDDLLGERIWDVLPDLKDTRFADHMQRTMENRLPIQLTERYDPLDTWLQVKAFPFENGISVYATDVTAERQAQEALLAGHDRATDLLESIGDAFVALNADWTFTYVNAQAEALLQVDETRLIGQRLWDVFPEAEGSRFEYEYRRAMEEGVTVEFTEYYPPLDLWVDVKAFPFDDGLSVYFSDVTQHKEREGELRDRDRRHRLALEAAGIGEFDLCLNDGRFHHSPQIDALFGFDDDASEGAEAAQSGDHPGDRLLPFARRVHPDDLSALRDSVTTSFDEPGPWRHRFRVHRPDGGYRILEGRGETLRSDDGTAHLMGVLRPIQDEERADEAT